MRRLDGCEMSSQWNVRSVRRLCGKEEQGDRRPKGDGSSRRDVPKGNARCGRKIVCRNDV